jgi:transcriptional regulator with XRE-family HTH domain
LYIIGEYIDNNPWRFNMYQNRIGFWIKERGIKLKYISDRVMVSYQTVSNWSNNRSQPDLLQAAELADLLGVKVDDLYERIEE